MRKRVLMGVAAMGYSKLIVALAQLVLVPVLAVRWGLPLYGQWLLLSTVPAFLVASDFGFGWAAGNRVIGEVAKRDLGEALRTFQSAWWVTLALTGVALILSLAIVAFIPARWLSVEGGMGGVEARLTLAVLCLYGLVGTQGVLFAAVARAVGKQAASFSLISTIQLSEALAVLGTAFSGGGPLQAALACLAVAAVGLLLSIAFAARIAPWLEIGRRHARAERMRELVRPSVATMMWTFGQAVYLQGTALAVGAAGGAAMVPIFTGLRTLSRAGLQLMVMFNLPLMPDFTAAHALDNRRKLELISGLVTMVNVAFGAAFGLVLAAFGLRFMDLWTKGTIIPPHDMILLTAAGLVLAVLWNALSSLLFAINRHEGFTYIFVALAAVTIGLTYWLVRGIGVTGAALANLLLDAAMAGVVWSALRKHVGRVEIGVSPFYAIIPHRWRSHPRR